jgi:hypothetical protein
MKFIMATSGGAEDVFLYLDFGTVPIVGYIFILFLILFYTNW